MKKSIKAVLLSALVFPGAGQLLLKRYYSAVFFMTFASIGLYLLFNDIYTRAQAIVEKIQSGEVSADIASITELVHQQSSVALESFTPALIILLITWSVSVVEAYRLGRKLESNNT